MRRLLLLGVLGGCQQSHTVALQLGPDDHTVTAGLLCHEDEPDQARLLLDRALNPITQRYELSVVVDIIDLGGRLPGCRGEELVAACTDKPCTIVEDGSRYCQEIAFARADVMTANLQPLLDTIRTTLARQPVTLDAPDRPVLVRAVATTERCDALPASFDLTKLVGCAYSCPVQLDSVTGPIALSLDVLDTTCRREVEACARFP